MIQDICKDEAFLARKGALATPGDLPVAADLLDTLKVRWQNKRFQERLKTFTGWTAQIIQHEIDHCEGIII